MVMLIIMITIILIIIMVINIIIMVIIIIVMVIIIIIVGYLFLNEQFVPEKRKSQGTFIVNDGASPVFVNSWARVLHFHP